MGNSFSGAGDRDLNIQIIGPEFNFSKSSDLNIQSNGKIKRQRSAAAPPPAERQAGQPKEK